MDKQNPNIKKVLNAKDWYSSIQHSAVAWRRKSSYKKSIKRISSVLARRANSKIIQDGLE